METWLLISNGFTSFTASSVSGNRGQRLLVHTQSLSVLAEAALIPEGSICSQLHKPVR